MAGGAEGDLLVRVADVRLGFVVKADQLSDIGQVFL